MIKDINNYGNHKIEFQMKDIGRYDMQNEIKTHYNKELW